MATRDWNIILNGVEIDTVRFTADMTRSEVYEYLTHLSNRFPPEIVVKPVVNGLRKGASR